MAAANNTVSQEELWSFHRIDQALYTVLVKDLFRDPSECMKIMGFWVWFERRGFPNVINQILKLPPFLVNEFANEAVTCLMRMNNQLNGMNEIPLTQCLVSNEMSCNISKTTCPSSYTESGIDLSENKRNGISSLDFAHRFQQWVLCYNLIWISFQGSYDFALLIKILTGELPYDLRGFMRSVITIFGGAGMFDVKLISSILGYHGGLEKLGKSLGLTRLTGNSHQAGSDSLFTMQVYIELFNKWYFTRERLARLNHKLYGLVAKVSKNVVVHSL